MNNQRSKHRLFPQRRAAAAFNAVALAATALISACGPLQPGSSSGSPVAATLAYIRDHGFPRLSDLLPQLPPQLSRVPGVESNAAGMPELADEFSSAAFGDGAAALEAVLSDATQLSAQGFSESRRLELMILNLAGPIYDMLGRTDLFRPAGGGEPGDAPAIATDEAGLQGRGLSLEGRAVSNVFERLAGKLSYAINVGGSEGLPDYIVLGVDDAAASINISGLWPDASRDGGGFLTGFNARVRINSLEDLELTLTMAPGTLAGLLPQWNASSCADDLWQISLATTPAEGQTLAVAAHECPGQRDAVSQLAFSRRDEDDWGLAGGFAQSYQDADGDSLRGWLGKRQGFVMQAAASSDLERLAAAAAVLGENDFNDPSQEMIDEFGVGQLIAKYFQAKYFDPRAEAAAEGSIFTQYDNVAYWACAASGVAAVIQEEVPAVKRLCDGKAVDVESALGALSALDEEIQAVDLAPASVKSAVKRLVGILSIRNSLYVGKEGEVTYKKAPSEAFAALDASRKGYLPGALGATDWQEGALARMPRLTAAEVPDNLYGALTGVLGQFLDGECAAIVENASSMAGKDVDADAACAGGE